MYCNVIYLKMEDCSSVFDYLCFDEYPVQIYAVKFPFFLIIISNLIICILKCMNFVLLLFSIYGCIIFYVGLGY